MAINDFEGTVLLVSHDRALLRSVCEEFWLVSRSGITDFKGDMDEYQKYLLEESKKLRDAQAQQGAPQDQPKPVQMKGLSRQEKKLESQKKSTQQQHHQSLKKELQSLESQMKSLEVQRAALLDIMSTQSLALPESNQGGSGSNKAKEAAMELAKNSKNLKEVELQLEKLEEKWLELSQQMESASLS
jgi:ATP-binding cassette subfamily F protein 3